MQTTTNKPNNQVSNQPLNQVTTNVYFKEYDNLKLER